MRGPNKVKRNGAASSEKSSRRASVASSITSVSTSSDDDALARKLDLTSVKRVDLNTLASSSDVLFVLAPGGPATHHIVSTSFHRVLLSSHSWK